MFLGLQGNTNKGYKIMKKSLVAVLFTAALLVGVSVLAQDAAPAAGQLVDAATGAAVPAAPKSAADGMGFYQAVVGGGVVGFILWLGLFVCGAAAIYYIVDCYILIRPQKIMPEALIEKVRAAMAEGDLAKALQACESEPGPMANILKAGFSHVEEGYEVIEEAVGTAADLETERLMQRLNWISVCANLAPMLGLLGTVQGMIGAFAALSGTPDIGVLSVQIAVALYTTAGGLVTAIPAVAFYFGLRNNANRLILRMSAMTMELSKDLRHVEVVAE